MKYDQSYSERVLLKDGTAVLLRMIVPSDKGKLLEGFSHLSPMSRYERFLAPKHEISLGELSFLTEVDSVDHCAIGAALELRRGREGRGIGIARFVRLKEDKIYAEPAVTVVDDMQGKGLGGILMESIREAALERGISYFRSFFLAGNRRMRNIIAHNFPDTEFVPDGSTVTSYSPLKRSDS